VIEPFSAATLGGLAYDTAKTAIATWVGSRIDAGLDTALRNRQFRQSLLAKDEQAELAAVIRAAVDLTAAEFFPDQRRRRRRFRKALLAGDPTEWPLVGGSDLTDLVADVHAWISRNDPQPGSGQETADPEVHRYVSVLCRNIIAQFGFRAENNGARNSILFRGWDRFWATELFTKLEEPAPSPGAETESRDGFNVHAGLSSAERQLTVQPPEQLEFTRMVSGIPVRTLVQAGTIHEFHQHSTLSPVKVHSFEESRLLVGRIPTLAAARQGREVDQVLAEVLDASETEVLCQVLSGMGGVGKTQIAAAYARRRWEAGDVDLLVWVNAAKRESIVAVFAEAAAKVCGVNPADDRAVEVFLSWLDRPEAPRWLIVLDDMTEPTDLWPPESARGRTVVTTRRRNAAFEGARRTRIEVDLFSQAEAEAYLTRRLAENAPPLEGAEQLIGTLGHLPLALAQAAAYILDHPGMTCAAFRELLTDQEIALAGLNPIEVPDGYGTSLATALSLSIKAADPAYPNGLPTGLLALACLLDPAGIPPDLFTTKPVRAVLASPSRLSESDAGITEPTRHEVTRAVGRLHQLSLFDSDGATIRVHALVQQVVRAWLEADQLAMFAGAAADALVEVWPELERDPQFIELLRANTSRLQANAGEALFTPNVHPVLFRAGYSIGDSGYARAAAAYFDALLTECTGYLGADHRTTHNIKSLVAKYMAAAGDVAGAVAVLEQLLADQLRVWGPDHRATLSTRHQLAVMCGEAGDEVGAIQALGQLLAKCVPVIGPEDPFVLTIRSNIAHWQGESGDTAGAVEALEQLLTDKIRILGSNDRDTLLTRYDLAIWESYTGETAEVVIRLEQLLNDCAEALGSDDTVTLVVRYGLAEMRGRASDLAGAVNAYEALLADCLRVLGPDHPKTFTVQANLARWRGRNGDPAGASAGLEVVLADSAGRLGLFHPKTLEIRRRLASWREEMTGCGGEGVALEYAVLICLRRFTPYSPQSSTSDSSPISLSVQEDEAVQATATFKSILADCLRELGPTHSTPQMASEALKYWKERSDSEGSSDSD
jgi:hypothetical protein